MIVDKCIGSKIFPRFIEPLEIRERFFSLRHSAKLKVPGLGYKRILIQVKLSYVFFFNWTLDKSFSRPKGHTFTALCAYVEAGRTFQNKVGTTSDSKRG